MDVQSGFMREEASDGDSNYTIITTISDCSTPQLPLRYCIFIVYPLEIVLLYKACYFDMNTEHHFVVD